MEFDALVRSRWSVKSFTDAPVTDAELDRIFDRVREAPTAFNLQPYRFLVLRSDAARQQAIDVAYDGNEWIGDAPAIVVALADERVTAHMGPAIDDMLDRGTISEQKADEYRERLATYPDRGEPFLTGWLTRNTMLPVAWFILAAWDEGIGTCPVRGLDRRALAGALDLADHERPLLLLPIGRPDGDGERKWRRPADAIYDVR